MTEHFLHGLEKPGDPRILETVENLLPVPAAGHLAFSLQSGQRLRSGGLRRFAELGELGDGALAGRQVAEQEQPVGVRQSLQEPRNLFRTGLQLL